MSVLQDRLRELKSRMPIDRTRLDEECVGQPVMYADIGEFVSELKRDARNAKDFLDLEHSRLRKVIRENPGAYGIAKLTESALEDGVITHDDYRRALQSATEAQYLADCANVLIAAAEQRKSMIKDAVALYIHEYFSTKDDMAPQKSGLVKVTEERINDLRRHTAAEHETEASREENIGVGSNG